MEKYISPINGHLDIIVAEQQDEYEGETEVWKEILIHGDPDGLRALANLLLELANNDQNAIQGLPAGARHHVHLRPGFELGKSSEQVIVGRLDAKGSGVFYDSYIPKD